jgi:transketolase C-terminal domain/subunit
VTNKYAPLEMVGVADRFGESGQSDEMLEVMKINAKYIEQAAQRAIARKS